MSGGSVYGWGNGSAGELGDGTNADHHSPTEVPGLSNVVDVAVGGYHSLARTSGGEVYAWGDNSDGRLGNGTKTPANEPVQVLDADGTSPLTGVTQIAAGDRVSLALVGGDDSNPPPSVDLASLDVSPQDVYGGTSATGTVTLTGPAPAGGTVVTLFGSNGAEVPSTITVPANETQATFGIGTIGVTQDHDASVTATLGATNKQADLTLHAMAIQTITGDGPINTWSDTGISDADGGPATAASFDSPDGITVDADGNVYFSDTLHSMVWKVAPDGLLTHIAGATTSGYSGDGGPAVDAELGGPQGLAIDASGNLYIVDSMNNAVREVVPGGTISTVVQDPVLHNAKGITIGSDGTIYVAAYGDCTVRTVPDLTIVAGVSGVCQSDGDGGSATSAHLKYPIGVAVDEDGNLYIADVGTAIVRKVDTNGTISTIAGNRTEGDSGDGGQATQAEIDPDAIALDGNGDLLIAQILPGVVRSVALDSGIITTIAGHGNAGSTPHPIGDGGPALSAQFNGAYSVAVGSDGSIYVGDGSGYVRRVGSYVDRPLTIDPTSGVGGYSATGTLTLRQPAPSGGLEVTLSTDSPDVVSMPATVTILENHTTATFTINTSTPSANAVVGITAVGGDLGGYATMSVLTGAGSGATIDTFAGTGNGGSNYGSDGDGGQAIDADLLNPGPMAFDANGNLFFVDGNRVREIATDGTISTLVGGGEATPPTDGSDATSFRFDALGGVAVDSNGNVYLTVLDSLAQYAGDTVWMVDSSDVLHLLAGTAGSTGYSGDGGPAADALLDDPSGIAVDSDGNVYFADNGNSVIRMIDATTGDISTVVGGGSCTPDVNSGECGDGGAPTDAILNDPYLVHVDGSDNLYIGNDYEIWEVSGGTINRIIGDGLSSDFHEGMPAIDAAIDVGDFALDSDGRVFIVEPPDNDVLVVNTDGAVDTFAGTGAQGYSGDGGPASDATFDSPWGVGVSPSGDLYISDTNNLVIRVIANP